MTNTKMKKVDILIIGGGPAGIVAAITARKNYPSKKITLIRKELKGVIPCGIPYIFRRLNSVDQNMMPDKPLLDNKINLIIGDVRKINVQEKNTILNDGQTFFYDKLILALGSAPQLIPIPGADKKGVWLVRKDYEYLKELRQKVLKSKNIVIIGGGFIGMEFADELSGLDGVNVSIVEMKEHCLISNFDQEFAVAAEEKLKNKGIKIITKKSIKEIGGNQKVEFVKLNDGEKILADLVILSIGARPNVALAREAGIEVDINGGIIVDEYLRTSVADVLAVGDCAQTKDFITGRDVPIMLASIATAEARIAANNLYEIELIRENKGTVGSFSTSIGGLVLGAAGLTEQAAQKERIDYLVGEASAINRHPSNLSGAEKIKVKLIFAKSSERLLLGGEIMGSESVGEMINILSIAIQQQTSVFDFNTWQIATHPLLTAAPTVYPIISAAQDALLKIRSNQK